MKTRSRLRSVLYSAVTVLIAAVVLEVGASWLMLVYYRATHQQNFETYDTSYLSVVNLARRFSRLVGLSEPAMVLEETSPSPFFRADPLLGYSAAPGVYTHSYARRNGLTDQWEYFRNKVTINSDGSRFVGAPRPGKPTVYIFGDSWVFGTGVPDDLTFAGRLYEALPDWNVRLLALGGYSLTPGLAHLRTPEGDRPRRYRHPGLCRLLRRAPRRGALAPARDRELAETHQPADPAVPAAQGDAGRRRPRDDEHHRPALRHAGRLLPRVPIRPSRR